MKTLHVSSVVLSISLFVLRAVLELQAKLWRKGLLGSALWLAWRIAQYPFVHGWPTARWIAALRSQ